MKKQIQILAVAVMTLGLAACQKPGSENGAVETASSDLGSVSLKNCTTAPSEDVSIVGLEAVKADKKARLSLSSSVNCDDGKLAVWRVGQVVIGEGMTIETEFVGSGNYVITVEIPKASDQKLGKLSSKTESDLLVVQQSLTVSNSGILVSGPQAGTEGVPYNFSVVLPSGTQAQSITWDFNDGSGPVSSLSPVSQALSAGVYVIDVRVVTTSGSTVDLQHQISILPVPDGRYCALDQLAIVGPAEVPVDRATSFSVNISSCLSTVITGVSWNFGDGTNPVTGATTNHSFSRSGTYQISAEISLYGTTITLLRTVVVSENLEEIPGPTPAPNPNRCTPFGSTRTIDGDTMTESISCGLDGSKVMTYVNKINQQCELVGEGLEWVTVSTVKTLVSEGACTGQSCQLVTENGTEKLADGASKSLFTNKTPVGSCSEVVSVRTCTNGVLSGSDEAKFLTCNNGCGEFGVHGTKQIGVVIGTMTTPIECQYGEAEVVAIFEQIADKTCENGSVTTTNVRQGELKTPGVCPRYSWVATDNYTACSAACGGTQDRIFECRNDKGQVAPADRCGTLNVPMESRICDGDPESVFKTETTVTQESAPSCATCPKNQIGVIVKEREVTTTSVVACVDHQIKTTQNVTYGPWVEESYCRDLTPSRCSKDSLSNSQAKGRHDWMLKCQDQVPVIKEFLVKFEDVKSKGGQGLDTPGRVLYPTFMDSSTKTVWKAPTNVSGSCNVPETVYIPGVCVSSCSTPEQQILVDHQNKVQNMTFIDAYLQKVDRVMTLQSNSSMSSKQLASTKVDAWVTELEDTDHEILLFKMKSGGHLKITTNHPILSQEGVMKLAADFQVGESLVQVGGKLDPIVSIEKVPYFGKVYNLFVKSSSLKKNVVVVNGYLNGTAFFQNEGAKHMNRAMFREQLFRGAFPESKK